MLKSGLALQITGTDFTLVDVREAMAKVMCVMMIEGGLCTLSRIS
jgi:hypothetical protein